MADFMDKLVSGINKSVANMSTGSKNMSERNKLSGEIKKINADIREVASELGINFYNYCVTNPGANVPAEQFASFIQDISAKNYRIMECNNRIAQLDAEMEQMKNDMNSERNKIHTKVCKCNTVNPVDAKFCSGCGSPLE